MFLPRWPLIAATLLLCWASGPVGQGRQALAAEIEQTVEAIRKAGGTVTRDADGTSQASI